MIKKKRAVYNWKLQTIKLMKPISAPSTLTVTVCSFEHTNINAAVNPLCCCGLNEDALSSRRCIEQISSSICFLFFFFLPFNSFFIRLGIAVIEPGDTRNHAAWHLKQLRVIEGSMFLMLCLTYHLNYLLPRTQNLKKQQLFFFFSIIYIFHSNNTFLCLH